MVGRKYKIKYFVEQGEFTKEDLVGFGGTDELMLCSYVGFPDGSGSYAWMSNNGKFAEFCDPSRECRMFGALAHYLIEREGLPQPLRDSAKAALECIRKGIMEETGRG